MSYYSEAPILRCPKCTHREDVAAHWEMKLDHERDCVGCGVTLRLVDEYAVRHWTWQVVPRPPHPLPKEEK